MLRGGGVRPRQQDCQVAEQWRLEPGATVTEVHYPKRQTFLEALQAGDFTAARRILAQAIWHEATDSARETLESAAAVMQGDLSLEESLLP